MDDDKDKDKPVAKMKRPYLLGKVFYLVASD